MNKTITLSSPGINWCWYLTLEMPTKARCRIIKHWRVHYEDKGHPTSNGSYQITEDEKPLVDGWHSRNAIKVIVWRTGEQDGAKGKTLEVTNPGYVFGYDGKTEQPEMHG